MESVTLSVYRDQQGGTALWTETQNVEVSPDGHWAAHMGANSPEGLPLELFADGQPRWLGTQFNRSGEVEQARVLLVAAPYALKAADAETLGGRPASAYALAPSPESAAADTAKPDLVRSPFAEAPGNSRTKPRITTGVPNCIGLFTNSTDIGCSSMWQFGGNIGIGTTGPAARLDLWGIDPSAPHLITRHSSGVYASELYPYNGSSLLSLRDAAAWDEKVRISSTGPTWFNGGNVGIGTTSPRSKLEVAGDIELGGAFRRSGSLLLHTRGWNNTAFGQNALSSVDPGSSFGGWNVALGTNAMASNTTGANNTAAGSSSLPANTTGSGNVAIGHYAMEYNTTGSLNTAVGDSSLASNTTGNFNTAVGESALGYNTTESANTGLGYSALRGLTAGTYNTAIGFYALGQGTNGSQNTAVGHWAGAWYDGGSNNIAIGYFAAIDVHGSNSYNIHIGNRGTAADNNTIRIGDSSVHTRLYVAGVRGATTASSDAVPVVIDSNGQLGTVSSSRRFKEDIHDMGAESGGVMHLRPVTFRYKEPYADGSKPLQYGLIAEEVAEVYPEMVAHSADGQIETVKYQALPAMLLNEVQRQEKVIRSLEERIAQLEARLAANSGAGEPRR